MLSPARWLAPWRSLGVTTTEPLRQVYERLLAAYGEPHRHYHTQQHLRECFECLESIRGRARHPAEVAIALWFHDAVYEPRSDDNELRSARWAHETALEAGVAGEVATRIRDLVMVTRHAAVPGDADAQVVVDVDLSILGTDAPRFAEYERQVRAEYSWVPGFVYRRRRRAILEQFLRRPRLFTFLPELEARGRENLRRSIAARRS